MVTSVNYILLSIILSGLCCLQLSKLICLYSTDKDDDYMLLWNAYYITIRTILMAKYDKYRKPQMIFNVRDIGQLTCILLFHCTVSYSSSVMYKHTPFFVTVKFVTNI